ncbi:hypothetical protein [Lacticigenium naphthae]|uniref:hypothetical protein n=1 Tax=Lacticigenium naphthae TaxID=515351 RepID=UPI00040CC227|nr:hypothetical protein [Lacticigenium naphthae]
MESEKNSIQGPLSFQKYLSLLLRMLTCLRETLNIVEENGKHSAHMILKEIANIGKEVQLNY